MNDESWVAGVPLVVGDMIDDLSHAEHPQQELRRSSRISNRLPIRVDNENDCK